MAPNDTRPTLSTVNRTWMSWARGYQLVHELLTIVVWGARLIDQVEDRVEGLLGTPNSHSQGESSRSIEYDRGYLLGICMTRLSHPRLPSAHIVGPTLH